jgi:hypothetical protein
MSQNFGNAFLKKPPQKDGIAIPKAPSAPSGRVASVQKPPAPRQTYSKVFRWRPPKGQTPAPALVEVAGTFTGWQKVPLIRDGVLDAWHVTLHSLQCGRMHHYMLLVDGQPVRDKHCDGLAVPHGSQEEQYQLMTDRGPRVLMLFAQTK